LEDLTPGLRGLLIGFVCGLFPLAVLLWMSVQGRRSR
jgi:hypothetical protein